MPKSNADRDCQRSCNLLWSKEFNDKFRKVGDPEPNFYAKKDKKNRDCCWLGCGLWFG